MSYKYAFYIHHHGSGHLTRALAIAAQLPSDEVVFLGSSLETYKDLIPKGIRSIELPFDIPANSDRDWAASDLSFLHYAPLNVKGIINRNYLITKDTFSLWIKIMRLESFSIYVYFL